ncbi:MAG: methyltransferase domain-containing protein, partial [Candidatus Sungbacteria bacterium]|nr:methyltransferase domain-containing protein [Candidatus Sungbacteria bacterium]
VRNRIRQGIFDPKDFTQESYALVSCFQALEHVHDPLLVSRGAYSLLKKGGMYFTVSHNYRGGVNKILGTKSPIYDIEHLQLFSPDSITALMKQAGFSDIRVFPIWNSYPLHYWIKLFPMPKGLKRGVIKGLKAVRLAGIPLAAPVGNMGVIATK